MDRLRPFQNREYESYFNTEDGAFQNGRVVATKKYRGKCWQNWIMFVQTLVVDPWLQDDSYQQRVLCLTGFVACVRLGRYGQIKQVQIGTLSGAFLAVGKTVAFAYEGNTTNAQGDKSLVPRLAQTML